MAAHVRGAVPDGHTLHPEDFKNANELPQYRFRKDKSYKTPVTANATEPADKEGSYEKKLHYQRRRARPLHRPDHRGFDVGDLERPVRPGRFQHCPCGREPVAPQVVSVFERDFGWRIADVIPIEIYLKQKPGTFVDLHSLAIEGDFEIVENPTIVTRDFKDGSRSIAVKFKVQSMSAAKKLTLKVSMVYKDVAKNGQDHSIAIPAFEPFTSPTWDGRDIIKDGSPKYIHEYHLVWNLGYITLGFAVAFMAFRWQRKWREEAKAKEAERQRLWHTRRQIARREFDEAWAHIEAGDFDIEHYKAIANARGNSSASNRRSSRRSKWNLAERTRTGSTPSRS